MAASAPRRAALVAGVACACVGAGTLIGWALGDAALGGELAPLFGMKPNTALSFVLAGTALCLAGSGVTAQSMRARGAMLGCALAVTAIGGLTLLEYVAGWQLGIDELLFREVPGLALGTHPGRMAPATAVNWVLLGAALAWEAGRARDPRPAHGLALAGAVLPFLALIGYAYEFRSLHGMDAYTRMAIHTALAFLTLSSGILALRPDRGIVAVITGESSGSVLARRLLPAAIIVPIVVGWLRVLGQEAGLYELAFGTALNALANVALFVVLVLWTALTLHRTDGERRRVRAALEASERRYRELAEASLDGIVVADQDGRITLFNPAAERTFGYAAAEVEGQPIAVLMPPEFRQQHQEGLERYARTREARLVGRTVEVTGRRKDGTHFPLELSLGALDVRGRVQFVGSLRDVTEQRRLRAAMVQSEKLASIGLLSAGVAHEINNPLAYVANNLAVLERDTRQLASIVDAYEAAHGHIAAADPASAARIRRLADEMDLPYVRANLDRILASTREGVARVTRIVQAMRGMARTGPTPTESLRLADLIDMSIELVRGRIERRGIAIEVDCGSAPPIRGTSSQLAQVLLNLLVNAVQAVEAAKRGDAGCIRIAGRPVGHEVLIEVADNGCGIPEQDLPHLFDPFFTTKDVGEGTGLGLAISHGIVSGHDGRIEVTSEVGKGSCFRVFLPLRNGGVV